MIVKYRINIHLDTDSVGETVYAMQGDTATREVTISLYSGGQPWLIPDGVKAAVAYRKADGTKGIYDKLPNKAAATSIDGSTVTAILAPQVLTVPGEVKLSIVLFDAQLDRLATFPLKLIVTPDPSAGQAVSNDYYNFTTLEEVNAAVDAALAELEEAKQDFLTKAEEALAVVHDSATEDAPAIVCKGEGEIVSVSDAAYRPLVGLKLFGKTTQDGTPTPAAPVDLVNIGASGEINTTVAGKNWLENLNGSGSRNGIDYIVNEDGSYTCVGTSTADNSFGNINYISDNARVIPPGDYILSGGKDGVRVQVLVDNVSCAVSSNNNEVRFTVPETATNSWARLSVLYAGTTVNTTVYPMLRLASVEDSTYEPYKPIQTLTASTPNGLPGIPVHSGGNNTDADGQQYLSTYRDWARGVDVHRIGGGKLTDIPKWNAPEVLAGLDDWRLIGAPVPSNWYRNNTAYKYQRTTGLFTHGSYNEHWAAGYTHGFMSMANVYVVAPKEIAADVDTFKAWITAQDAAGNTPEIMVVLDNDRVVETPIPAEELAAYAALHSNKPNTTVYNDAGAHMAVEYVADTKIYTDNKFAALQAAILSQGANV